MKEGPPPIKPDSQSVRCAVDEIRIAMARGELLQAYDLAQRALVKFPNSERLRYAAILALARAGATRQARIQYGALLGNMSGSGSGSALYNDIAALDARIRKDEALATVGLARRRLLAEAADRYLAIFRRTGGYYPGINAATLSLLSGNHKRAKSLAREVAKAALAISTRRGPDAYFASVSAAEAALILGDPEAASEAIKVAARDHHYDFSALATTRHQLKLVCDAVGLSKDLLAPLSTPAVIHYTGHMIGSRFHDSEEGRVRAQIAHSLERLYVGFGYGSLAAGADILFAEELLKRGADVNLVIPFDTEDFKRVSVVPSGREWIKRFDACNRAAKTVSFATTDRYMNDHSLFAYGGKIAMGLALLRARFLAAPVYQIAVWDGDSTASSDNIAGTYSDVAFWRRRGLPSETISSHRNKRSTVKVRSAASRTATQSACGRLIRAILFCDVKGFSKLGDEQLLAFEREVLPRFARILDRYRRRILFRNTWGDGLYVVAFDAETAASCAMDMLAEMESLVPAKHGLPADLGIRLGGHVGPVFRMRDPVLKRWNFIGSHVNRTAMIEPITPPGAAYVTEAFAAELATNRKSSFDCEYVGQVPAAKNYGTMRMYSLKRSRSRVHGE
jgi:tetratricopeptide (TPR) repeat protein